MKKYVKIIICALLISLGTTLIFGCGHVHSWVDATCTTPKTCSECGETEGTALGHSWGEWEVTREPSCSSSGEKVRQCLTCGKKDFQEEPTIPHTPEDEWTIIQEATYDKPGVQVKKCTVCGEEALRTEFELTSAEKKTWLKENCEDTNANKLMRSPEYYQGQYVNISGKIIQVLESNGIKQYLIKDGNDMALVEIGSNKSSPRFLENDFVEVYGVFIGLVSYETVLGVQKTVPAIEVEIIESKW